MCWRGIWKTLLLLKKDRVRTYTLPKLIESIESVIEQTEQPEPGDQSLRTPSLATVKNWSRTGMFKNAVTLQAATKLAIASMKSNTRYYADSRSKRSGPAPAGSIAPGIEPGLAAQILQEICLVASRLTVIEQSLEKEKRDSPDSSDRRSEGLDDHSSQAFKQVATVIEQLDATRRHLMVRFDNEMLLCRQSNQPQAQQETPSFLDTQRILLRLSNIEQILASKKAFNEGWVRASAT